MSGRWLVMLEEDVPLDPRQVAAPLAQPLGCTPIEARMMLRRARGIVADRLEETRARAVVEALRAAGIAAEAVELATVPDLRTPVRVVHLTRSGDLLVAHSGEGREEGAITFAAVFALHGGAVGTELYARRLAQARFHAAPDLRRIEDPQERAQVVEHLLRRAREMAAKAPKDAVVDEIDRRHADSLQVYIDLFTEDATWWRLRMDQCAYQFREGSARLGSAIGFRYLLEHLTAEVPAERASPMVAKLIRPTPLEEVTFLDIEEYGRYALWWMYRRWRSAPPHAAEEIRLEEPPDGA